MSAQCEVTDKQATGSPMGNFERYLSVWVFLCIAVGIGLGQLYPGVFRFVGRLEVARINLPVAVMIWLMIIPMLLKIDLRALKGVTKYWRGVGVTLFVNWAVKPFSMALLAWLFIRGLFADWLPAEQIDSYIAGLILLATLVLLFGFQGEQIIAQPVIILLLAVPILIQVFFNSGLAYLLNRWVRSPHFVAGPSALIGASNFFELAVATAIVLFGFESGAALATVVGVLIEVPVMLFAVRVVNRTRGWYERRAGVPTYEECCPADLPLHSEH